MAALEWERIRRRSPSVQEFADNFRAEVSRLPVADRAGAYRDTLQNISPLLEKRVAAEAQLWMDRGYSPDRALRAATYASLIGRRRALFHGVFVDFAEEQADRVMETIGAGANLSDVKVALDQLFDQLRQDPLLSHPKPDGAARLREAGFPDWFIDWAVKRKPLDADDIRDEMTANMNAGMDGREAMRRAIVLAIREFSLDYMMATGVAKGPDFCGIAATVIGIVTTVVGVAVSAAGGIVGAVRGARQAREQRDQNARFEAQYYMDPLSDAEVDAKVAVFYERGLTKAQAGQALVDYLRAVRMGRTQLLNQEVQAFDDAWRRRVQLASTAIAQERGARDMPRKLVAYGVPALGALVLVVSLATRKKRA